MAAADWSILENEKAEKFDTIYYLREDVVTIVTFNLSFEFLSKRFSAT